MSASQRAASGQAEGQNAEWRSSHGTGAIRSQPSGMLDPVSRLRSDESWVELASRPSSSSLSSAATDEIITTGLRVQRDFPGRRRPRRRALDARALHADGGPPTGGSSQEEYDESDSEEDAVITSSTELAAEASGAMRNQGRLDEGHDPDREGPFHDDSNDDDDDDDDDHEDEDDDDHQERATATDLGMPRPGQAFVPQPNVFSHPPSSEAWSQPGAASVAPPRLRRSTPTSHSPPTRRPQHGPFNVISPSYQADHDAALRASLSTLLSCAAAARGLSKPSRTTTRAVEPSALDHTTLRILPGSALPGADRLGTTTAPFHPRSRSRSQDKGKRRGSMAGAKEGKERMSKRPKRAGEDPIMSPTVFAWVVSAGVVVLVGAISFSAGYAIGKEVGRAQVSFVEVGDSRSCGKEAVRGLRRLRWGTSSAGVVPV
ncbi:MAG: hypothetical protein M1826_005314 [Phylliscum demangeonii]|nr:MAG: hypothetical protein M1826_005314 [Phylliscum demangeonii]